ncbi:MAG: transporter substrate-binding protein [Reyranella sp.]|nr:transporter substrate-binding protein [Reyranella sp.]
MSDIALKPAPAPRGRFANLVPLEPGRLLWFGLAAVMIFLVVYPLWQIVSVSLHDGDGNFTFENYAKAFGRARYIQSFTNSLWLGVCACFLSLCFAVPISWGLARTDMPGKRFVWLGVIGAYVMPPFMGAIGWILLAGPNAGWLNRIFRGLSGMDVALFDIYTFSGLVFVVALYSFPLVFVFVNAALELVSSEMEDAGAILGASIWHVARRITIPIVLPTIIGAGIIVFLEAVSLFGAPALLGTPARISVVTTTLFEFFSNPVRVEVAAAYSMPLLLITVILFLLQYWLIRRRGYVTQTGKGGERRMMKLGAWRWAVFAYGFGVIFLAVILPLMIIVQAALSKAWGQGFSLDNLTLNNFRYILFEHSTAGQTVVNSAMFSFWTATFAVTLTLLIAYIVNRKLVPFSGVLGFLAVTPFVIPGIVLAIGFYAAYAPPPLALYGTGLIMVLSFTTRFMPVAYINAASGMRSLHPEMEEAVRILGGSRMTAIRRVIAPLLKRSLAGAWLIVFIGATRELSTAIFLYVGATRTMSIMIYDLSEEGRFEHLSALGLVLVVATMAFVAIGFRVVGRDFMLKRS